MAKRKENEKTEKTYTEAEVMAIIAKLQAEQKTVIVDRSEPKVTMRFKANVSTDNQVSYGENGKYGLFTGNDYIITVDKTAFIGDFRTSSVQSMLAERKLIVLDGLDDDERKRYGVDYREGEYLTDNVFEALTTDAKKLEENYSKMCLLYKEMIAAKYIEMYEAGTLRASREEIEKLNEISKGDYANYPAENIRRKGAFFPIIEAMNKKSIE